MAFTGLLLVSEMAAVPVAAQRLQAAGLMAYIPQNDLTKGGAAWQISDKTPVFVRARVRACVTLLCIVLCVWVCVQCVRAAVSD